MTDAILVRDWPLSRPCNKCGADILHRCLPDCHVPAPNVPDQIRILPGDAYDPNPDQHPDPVESDLRKVLI